MLTWPRMMANRADNNICQLQSYKHRHSFTLAGVRSWHRLAENMCDFCHCLTDHTCGDVGHEPTNALDAHLLQTSGCTHHSMGCVALQLLYLRLDGQPSKEVSHPHIWHVRAEALELVADLQQAQMSSLSQR